MPPITYPTLTVRTEYPGSAPEEVEKNITDPIEEALASISNLVSYNSISRSGISDVILEFSWNTDMTTVIQEVREKTDRVNLPEDVLRPLILRYDPTLDPIIRLGFFGDVSLYSLRNIAEYEVKRVLETVPGVASVRVLGGLEEEVRVELDERKLSARGITIDTVIQRIREENLNTPCGLLREGERTYLVRTRNEFQNLEEINNLIVSYKNDIPIFLKDIGKVIRTHRDREVITRVEGKNSVEVEIYKEAEANIVAVSKAVRLKLFGLHEKKKVENKKESSFRKNRGIRVKNRKGKGEFTSIQEQLPSGVFLQVLTDQSLFIEQAIHEVIKTGVSGGILAIIILYLFLRHSRSTLVVGIAIPISIIATFAPLHLSNTSLNIMSLGGLALGIGMLVDNAIVVLESIVRNQQGGNSLKQSSIKGTQEVGGAIIASTLTTIAVFLPILYIEGIAGQIFTDQAKTVVFSLLASLVVAVVVIPVLSSRDFQQSLPQKKWSKEDYLTLQSLKILSGSEGFKKIFTWTKFFISFLLEITAKCALFLLHILLGLLAILMQLISRLFRYLFFPLLAIGEVLGSYASHYPKLLRWVLKNSYWVVGGVLALSALATYCLLFLIGTELVPELHQGEFNLHITLNTGTPLTKTSKVTKQLEDHLLPIPEIEKIFSKMGVEKTNTANSEEGEHTSVITCILNTSKVSALEEDAFINSLRGSLPNIPEIKSIRFTRPALFSTKTPIEIEIYGYNLDQLKDLSLHATSLLHSIPGLYDIKISLEKGNPEFQISYNHHRLFKHGLRVAEVADTIRYKIQGENAGKFRLSEKEIPIIVRLQAKDRQSLESIKSIVVSKDDQRVYLSQVSQTKDGEGPSEIRHLGQQRVVLVRANLYGIDLKGMAINIEKTLNKINWPEGSYFRVGGQNEERKVATQSLQFALLLAAFLVYVVMASQFESLKQPLIIMFTMPLAFLGVIFSLTLFKIPISIMVLIGVIILCGIVVNNAIVMLDCINQLRAQGKSLEEAVIEGARIRLRPILMTTLSTVLGLLPMTGILFSGAGQGVEIRKPLAITVISGLLSSTLLTLIIIPMVYSWIEKRKEIGLRK